MDMKKIEAAARAAQLPKITTSHASNAHLSFNIVNSPRNGKRLRLSRGLACTVGVTKSAAMLPLPDEGLLMVAEKLPYKAAIPVSLKDDYGAKIGYNSGMVALLTEVFNLSFENHVSMSFSDITLDQLEDGTPVALISITDKYAAQDTEPAVEQ